MTLGLARSLRKRITYMGSALLMVSEDCRREGTNRLPSARVIAFGLVPRPRPHGRTRSTWTQRREMRTGRQHTMRDDVQAQRSNMLSTTHIDDDD